MALSKLYTPGSKIIPLAHRIYAIELNEMIESEGGEYGKWGYITFATNTQFRTNYDSSVLKRQVASLLVTVNNHPEDWGCRKKRKTDRAAQVILKDRRFRGGAHYKLIEKTNKEEEEGFYFTPSAEYDFTASHSPPFYAPATKLSSSSAHNCSSTPSPPSSPTSPVPPTFQKGRESDFIDLCSDDDDIPIVLDGEDSSFPEELVEQQRQLLACYSTETITPTPTRPITTPYTHSKSHPRARVPGTLELPTYEKPKPFLTATETTRLSKESVMIGMKAFFAERGPLPVASVCRSNPQPAVDELQEKITAQHAAQQEKQRKKELEALTRAKDFTSVVDMEVCGARIHYKLMRADNSFEWLSPSQVPKKCQTMVGQYVAAHPEKQNPISRYQSQSFLPLGTTSTTALTSPSFLYHPQSPPPVYASNSEALPVTTYQYPRSVNNYDNVY